jgi:uncharacterized protein (TIGR02145 family)
MKNILVTISFFIIASNLMAQVTDIDGNHYKTVKIGKQEWMAENLNVSHFRNGDPIPEIRDSFEWYEAGDKGLPSWCYYNNDPGSGRIYHKLYNWFTINDWRGCW